MSHVWAKSVHVKWYFNSCLQRVILETLRTVPDSWRSGASDVKMDLKSVCPYLSNEPCLSKIGGGAPKLAFQWCNFWAQQTRSASSLYVLKTHHKQVTIFARYKENLETISLSLIRIKNTIDGHWHYFTIAIRPKTRLQSKKISENLKKTTCLVFNALHVPSISTSGLYSAKLIKNVVRHWFNSLQVLPFWSENF